MRSIKRIYVCSPLRGDYEKNIENAIRYSKEVWDEGNIPVTPHIYFPLFSDDTKKTERKKGTAIGIYLLKHCDELRVFGDRVSEGMEEEIKIAEENNVPVTHVSLVHTN